MEADSTHPRDSLRALQADLASGVGRSRASLNLALSAAWKMGQTLDTEKRRARRQMGRGAWPAWLAANFPGSQKAALRLMRLARSISDERQLSALSLRQAYFRLGIPTEPKKRAMPGLARLPHHVRSAQRLLLSVRMRLRMRQMDAAARRRLREDLAPLRRQLEVLFADTD